MTIENKTRRFILLALTSLFGGFTFVGRAIADTRTPKAAEGPFYPTPSMRVPDTDNDLVKIQGEVEEAGGEVITLRGIVTDRNARPLVGHRVEIWQCDVNGKYLHTGDNRNLAYDQAFQGFGHDMTDDNGAYIFRTIKPTTYPGRTPHIHVKVCEGDRELLTTQFYIKGHANNAQDSLFNRLSAVEIGRVSMDFVEGEGGTEATVNIVV